MSDEALWTTQETADYLKVSVGQVRKMYGKDTTHQLPFVRLGTSVRFRPDAVRAWATSREVGTQR